MLFYDKAQEYLAKEKENLAPLTVRTYYWNLKKIQYFRPDLECASVDEATIREFRNHMLQQGNKPATVNKALSVFRIFTNPSEIGISVIFATLFAVITPIF